MSISPQKLEKWNSNKDQSIAKVFDNAFSLPEKMELSIRGGPIMGRSAHYGARQTLACLARMVEGNTTRRALVQIEDHSQGMVVDVLSCDGALVRKRDDKKDSPLIMARVSFQKKCADIEDTKKIVDMIAKTMPKSGGVHSIKAGTAEEMGLLQDYFKKNRNLLSNDFLHDFEKKLAKKFFLIPGSFTTFISPLLTGEMDGVCNVCGKRSTSVCSRCKLVHYCSRQCQSKDWKKDHKNNCVSILEARESKSYVEIDPAKLPKDWNYGCSISNHQSVAFQLQKTTEDCNLKTMINKQLVGKLEVLKVQVQLDPFVDIVSDSGSIYVYSKGKKFEMHVDTDMFTNGFEGYKSLSEVVREKGDGGMKLYVLGFVTETRKLRILTDKVLPLQPW